MNSKPKSILIILFVFLMPLSEVIHCSIHPQNNGNQINKKDTNGLKQGLWIYVNENSEIITDKGHYSNDLKNGVWSNYYNDGSIKSEITYIKGNSNGKATFYYQNGQIRETGNWQIDHWVGNYKYYFKTGKLSYDWNYNKNGKRDGQQIYFHKNGNTMYKGVWNEGKTEGSLKVYNEDGILIEEKQYDDGNFSSTKKITGQREQSGQKNETSQTEEPNIPRLKFESTGKHTIINDLGKISVIGYFIKGSLFTGEKFNYNKNGQLISITYYNNGKEGETKIKSTN